MGLDEKLQKYQRIIQQVKSVIEKTDDLTARMASVIAIVYHSLDSFFWAGFYRFIDGELLIGPYQGTLACQRLPEEKGVCWAAVEKKQTIIVPDVEKFPGHIACDKRSKSEIVVPCFDADGEIFAVLDVDSEKAAAFDEIDAANLEKIVKILCQKC